MAGAAAVFEVGVGLGVAAFATGVNAVGVGEAFGLTVEVGVGVAVAVGVGVDLGVAFAFTEVADVDGEAEAEGLAVAVGAECATLLELIERTMVPTRATEIELMQTIFRIVKCNQKPAFTLLASPSKGQGAFRKRPLSNRDTQYAN